MMVVQLVHSNRYFSPFFMAYSVTDLYSHKNSHQKGKVNGCLVTLLARGKYLASECLTRQCAVKKTSENALKRRVNTNLYQLRFNKSINNTKKKKGCKISHPIQQVKNK
ncbi:hypothetical protein [Symbiopectobacterium purcellii]|uniref:hypothetical protein n=1 Tax=Symbiopectobacterium purcellii TaxID=2871826 RepID=UPI003F85A6DE